MRWTLVALLAVLIVSVTWWKTSGRSIGNAPEGVASNSTASTIPVFDNASAHRPRPPRPFSETRQGNVALSKTRRDESRAKAKQIVELGRSQLLSQYNNEKVDPAWAPSREHSLIEHAISPQISELKAEPKNMTSRCRSSVCQITADFATPTAADDWFTLFLTNSGTDLSHASMQTTKNPDGTTHLEIYGVAR
jgi:hypothetical protein